MGASSGASGASGGAGANGGASGAGSGGVNAGGGGESGIGNAGASGAAGSAGACTPPASPPPDVQTDTNAMTGCTLAAGACSAAAPATACCPVHGFGIDPTKQCRTHPRDDIWGCIGFYDCSAQGCAASTAGGCFTRTTSSGQTEVIFLLDTPWFDAIARLGFTMGCSGAVAGMTGDQIAAWPDCGM